MGIASRKKWERRAATPTVTRKGVKRPRVVDAVKLAHRIDVTNTANVAKREELARDRARNAAHSKAMERTRLRKARTRLLRGMQGWRPHAQR
jgi:hypothetical protein